jgi:[protein-PII] uridylyltransferase
VLGDARSEIEGRFHGGLSGLKAARLTARMTDSVLGVLCDFALRRVFPVGVVMDSDRIAIAATGGYGRGEMAPKSDIDLLFLLPYKINPRAEQVVEYVLYMLWDLGLKVGHATRSVAECVRAARDDITIRTTLLDARLVAGDAALFEAFTATFQAEVIDGTALAFVEAKLAERDARHRAAGDTRYLLEPNIKEGKGGLRDLHTLYWIARYVYGARSPAELVQAGILTRQEAAAVTKANGFFWTLRFNLHLWAGRAEETLTFDAQKPIADRMGYTRHRGTRAVERLMKHYFLTAREVGNITRVLCASLQAQLKRAPLLRMPRLRARWDLPEAFRVEGDWLTIVEPDAFVRNPVLMLSLFREAGARRLDIHPAALRRIAADIRHLDRSVRRDPEAAAIFLDILTAGVTPDTTLRRMNEAGVLGRFLPDFGRIVCQMQFNMYHHYTVDEHTIRAIAMLDRMEKGVLPDVSDEILGQFRQINSRRALYVAMLLHDIAKGRGGDHSTLGAQVAARVCPQLGLTPEETETVVWLVLRHLLLNDTASKRDMEDPKTIGDLVAEVQSPERLRLLLLLTVADIHAVGKGVWNNWKGTMLLNLFHRAMDAMSGGMSAGRIDRRVATMKETVRAELSDWSDDMFERIAGLGYPAYWLAFDPTSHVRHLRLIARADAEAQPLSVDTRVDRARGVTEVTVYTADHPGLFASIAGALAVGSATVVDARIFTMTNGMALDSFWVQDIDGGPIAQSYRIARISAMISKALTGTVDLRALLAERISGPKRANAFTVWPRVLIDNEASAHHSVIEVNGRDRPGLLFDLTDTLTRLGLQIGSAHVTTFGERAVDVFYIKDVFGMKVSNKSKLNQIRTAMAAALDAPAAAGEA